MAKQRRTAGDSGKEPGKIPQPHGGALYAGGVPGNRGGGRQPAAIRALFRDAAADRIALLREIADGKVEDASTQDRLRALEILAKYGMGVVKEVSAENVRERVSLTLDVIRARCSPEQATAIINELKPVWA